MSFKDAWAALRADGSGIIRRVDEASKRDFYAAFDSQGRVGMMVISDREIAVKANFKMLEIKSLETAYGWQIYFWLTNPEFESLFDLFCLDLETSSEPIAGSQLTSFLAERVLRWKKLFETGSERLPVAEIRGLFGELVILKELCKRLSAEDVVTAWGGPLGAAQDFVFPDWSIETKTLGPNALRLEINSLNQLNIPPDRRLILASVMLVERSPDSEIGSTFEEIIVGIVQQIGDNDWLRSEFYSRLRAAGYDEVKYGSIRYHVFGTRYFQVAGTFPRLTPDQVPTGVYSASYELAISSIESFEIGSAWEMLRGSQHG